MVLLVVALAALVFVLVGLVLFEVVVIDGVLVAAVSLVIIRIAVFVAVEPFIIVSVVSVGVVVVD